MHIYSMNVKILLESPIEDKDKAEISIGPYAFKYADGTVINFDIQNSAAWLNKDKRTVFIVANDLINSSIPEGLTAEQFTHPTEIVSFYHEFQSDAENDTGTVLMEGILEWTFIIDAKEYNIPKEVLQEYNCTTLQEINDAIEAELEELEGKGMLLDSFATDYKEVTLDGDALAVIHVEGYSENPDRSDETIAKVWLTKSGDIFADWLLPEYEGSARAQHFVEVAKDRLILDYRIRQTVEKKDSKIIGMLKKYIFKK